ncbi:hypothetical protein [Nibricoccus sp. IMCC34717]|uniref:ParE family toxin-like protein n=1 Tax=Nibricoccus sp. IMCC34717 TaxID=3034021 RepID=UPI00384CD2EC
MNSYCTERFWNGYHALPAPIRATADKNYVLWRENPQHPSLHFKPVGDGFWSVRVGKHYRALGHREDEEITWVWIGAHAEYDHLLTVLKKRAKG